MADASRQDGAPAWRRFVLRSRMEIAAWIMGEGWGGVITRLWIIRDRARAAITPDGQVILAECESLAEALYAPMPGSWTLTVSRTDRPSDTQEGAR